jgi:hypothetical protein
MAEISPQATTGDIENDRDLDADMEDPQEENTKQTQDLSTSTLDHEPTQTETQPTNSTPHQNRKDTTLREFLSKMDDYAPIVRYLHFFSRHISPRPPFALCRITDI